MTVLSNGDTVILITSSQMIGLNRMRLELSMYREVIDSLITNDSIRAAKELLFRQAIKIRDNQIVVLQKIDTNNQQIISRQQGELLLVEKKYRKREKIIIGAGAGLLILTLFIK
ncbi:hypothetical protein SDC9_53736 [bioreactor metagenome]|uniref:Stage III sporulation protein AB n=1 Tax=bioreactor metagenome TaxID=1076179 RepID=A0A644WU64_9ZZZZ